MNQKISSFIKKNTSKLVTTATIVLLISILTGPSIVYYINNTDTNELGTSILLSSTNSFIEDSTEAIQLAELKKEEALKVVEPPKCKIERIVEPIVTPDWYAKIPLDAQTQYDEHIDEKVERRDYIDTLPPALQVQMVKNYEAEELQKEFDLLEAPRRKEREEAAAAYYYAQQQSYSYDYYYDDSSYTETSYEESAPEPSSPDGMTYYGGKELTAYEYTGNPCADGNWPQTGYTCASNDPNLWGKDIYIEGLGTYHVHDTGGMASSVIDIYMGDVEACYQFGRQYGDVYIID